MTIIEIENEYLKDIEVNRRAGTLRFKRENFLQINKFLEENGIIEFNQLNKDLYNSYITRMDENGNSNATINKRCGIIKQLIDFADKSLGLEINREHKRILNAGWRRENPKSYMPISKDNLQILKEELDKLNENHYYELRKKVMLWIFLQTGIRLTELINIKNEDLYPQLKQICLSHTKCNGNRTVYISEETFKLIEKLNNLSSIKSEYLFHGFDTEDKMSVNSIEKIFQRMEEKLGFKMTSHRIRSTFATNFINKTNNVAQCQTLMGHSRYETTLRYYHMDSDELRDISLNNNLLA